jgi:uncharacterized membrane protein YfcA
MIQDPWFYAVAVPAMILVGISKGGFGIIGVLHVPLMALAISPLQAAGISLPILVASDIVALVSYRRDYDRGVLRLMIPSALLGVAIGWATASWVSEHLIRLIVGLVAVMFGLDYFLRHKRAEHARRPNAAKGWFWGIVTGFVSFVSHSGGPPFQAYVGPLRLEPRIFAGTQVILFALINAVKLPPYFFLGQFDRENLVTAAIIAPVAMVSVFLGVWLVRRIDPQRFYDLIYGLVFVVGLALVWQGANGLL